MDKQKQATLDRVRTEYTLLKVAQRDLKKVYKWTCTHSHQKITVHNQQTCLHALKLWICQLTN